MREAHDGREVMSAALDDTFGALADPTRRKVVELLRREPRRAGDLAKALALTAPTMSRHLAVLRRAQLVEPDGLAEDARVRVYRLKQAPFDALDAWVREVRTFWSGQLDAFAAHVTAKAAAGSAASKPAATKAPARRRRSTP